VQSVASLFWPNVVCINVKKTDFRIRIVIRQLEVLRVYALAKCR
jgi:uncharacterized protein (DUF1800 family)